MLSINISEVIWTIACFFLLYFLLKKFLYDPVVSFMDARNAKVANGLEAERKVNDAMSKYDEELNEKLQRANAEASKLIADGKSADEQRRARTLNEARTQAAAIRKSLAEEAAAENEKTIDEIGARSAELSKVLCARLLGRS